MVHPTQQTPAFGRKMPPLITITRNGRSRSFRLRPWLAGTILGTVLMLFAAYVGATAYLLSRDGLLGATLTRQVRMQYAYEERLAALRAEIDRITSRHVVEKQGVEEQLALLLQRQDEIEERQTTLDGLVAKARDSGIDLAVAPVRLPQPKPAVSPALEPDGSSGTLAYSPAASASPTATDIITGSLIRGSETGSHVRLRNDLRPILSGVSDALDQAQRQQSEALDALSAAAEGESDKLSTALAPLGVNVEAADSDGPEGGPFIPAGPLHFVERTTLLDKSLDGITALRRTAEALPLRAPLLARAVSSGFGYRMDPFLHRPALHAGLDLAADAGTAVRATAAGTVVSAGWSGGYGEMVEIRHAGGISTRYGHLSRILVSQGQSVPAGAVIGEVGSTGRSTGPHLHYETRRDGEPVDPAPYLAAGKAL
jgi:murein DD-endopeptidase MepM/ murein hydrolase activator NlpD